MICPFCKQQGTEVIETRENEDNSVRRRRQCDSCQKRFTTYERSEKINSLVLKKDGCQEEFSEEKLKRGLIKACRKTKATYAEIEKIISLVLKSLFEKPDLTITSAEIGKIVMENLKKIDKVAYIRFVSVYREFESLSDFKKELNRLA